MVNEIELFEYPKLIPLDFGLWGWMKSEDYKGKVDKRDELLALNLDAAVRMKKLDLRIKVAKCTAADSVIFEH